MSEMPRLARRSGALLLASLAAGAALATGLSSANGRVVGTTDAAPAAAASLVAGSLTGGVGARAVVTQGETFFTATLQNVQYASGEALFAGSRDGRAATVVDDALTLKVVHQDGTSSTYKHDYTNGCTALTPLPPTDLSSVFKPGANTVTVTLRDKCGGSVSASALWLTPSPHLYWANASTNTIGRANLDGTGVDQSFITGASQPLGVAVDANYVYWANNVSGTIGRANLDGTGVNQSFITLTGISAQNIAVDAGHIYWSDGANDSIGRANLDGTAVQKRFINCRCVPSGVAVDANYVYWVNGTKTTIGRANLDGTGIDNSFVSSPTGLAQVTVDATHLYWSTFTIGRANLNGTGVNAGFISGPFGPYGLAVDASHIYWTNRQNGASSIGRANLDGTDLNQALIAVPNFPYGLAIDAG